MKKRVVALVLVLLMLVPAIASAVTYYRVNTSSLVVRMLPEDDAAKLATYSLDSALKFTKKIDSKWSYVEFIGGKEGYVQTKYISKIKSYSAWVTNDDTPIREGVAYNSTEVGRLARGAKVTVLTHGKKYDYVKSSIGYGYVMNGWLSKKKVKASGNASVPAFKPNANYTAYVTNGSRVVNLRAEPSTKSAIIMYYPTGTEVNVISHGADWDYIQVGSNKGYMMTRFLTTAKPAPTDVPATPTPKPGAYTAYVTSDNGKAVNVRKGPGTGHSVKFKAPYGSEIKVLEHNEKWDKIEQNGQTGYMQNKFITLSLPSGYATPAPGADTSPKPTATPFQPYTATVTCPEGEKVNVRSKPYKSSAVMRLDPGTTVQVVGTYPKDKAWVKVKIDGKEYYMKKEFLK